MPSSGLSRLESEMIDGFAVLERCREDVADLRHQLVCRDECIEALCEEILRLGRQIEAMSGGLFDKAGE